MAAQGLQFFTAGFETSASTIAYTLYEIAINPMIQTKLREEILFNIEKSKDINYHSIKEMKYLDLCIMGKCINIQRRMILLAFAIS